MTRVFLRFSSLLLPLLTLVVTGCADETPDVEQEPLQGAYAFDELPGTIPMPETPEDRPVMESRVKLGRYLFYDNRLSGNQTQSCSSCHAQEKAFTDGRKVGLGSTEEEHVRNPMSLTNVAYNNTYGWVSPSVTSLEDQAGIPLFGESPVELGLAHMDQDVVLERFRKEPLYQELFADAYPDFPREDRITMNHIISAIADFERTLLSFDSPYDRYVYGGDADALNDSEKRGMELFFSERLECFHCHGGFNFSDAVSHEGLAFVTQPFHNTGLYNVDFEGGFPARDRGLFDLTGNPDDMGRFKAPTLRNIEVTAPYFHDGSAATLEDVIAHYERGGRAIVEGEDLGDGAKNPHKSELIQGFILTESERTDLLAFLKSLTDETFLTDPRHAKPDDLPAITQD